MRHSPAGLYTPGVSDVVRGDDSTESGPPPEDFGCPVLQRAVEQVAASWDNRSADSVDLDEVRAVLHALARAVANGDPTSLLPACSSVLGRRLIQLLRAEVVRIWQEAGANAPPAPEIVDFMDRIERVQEAIQPNWSEFFASRLSDPDGLDLVVEIAHDLRSPLTSILFLAETLQRGQSGPVNDIQHRQLRLIYGAGLGLSSLASNVIELARGGDRLVDDEPSPFSVTEVLESVRDIVRPIAEEKGLAIRITPPITDHRMGHPIALSRVLLNLTTNALKFTDEGYVDLTARAGDGGSVEFNVRDTGHGIQPGVIANLYQPFRRAGGRDGYRFSGTGLGLAISRKLVEAMDSRLEVETKPDWGTRFFFELVLPPASK